MESDIDRFTRNVVPASWLRFFAVLVLAFLVNVVQAQFRPVIVGALGSGLLAELYQAVVSTVVVVATMIGAGGLVACYYFALRQRMQYTSVGEAGLALRSIAAGLLALGVFVLSLLVNGGLLRR